MNLNEKMAAILEIAMDNKRQKSIRRAERNKHRFVRKLMRKAHAGKNEGVEIGDADEAYIEYLHQFFITEGFSVSRCRSVTIGGPAHSITIAIAKA